MDIASLFVTLGIKGAGKTVGEILKVQKGLKETASTSLEAKAAIIGAMYALQRFFANSGQVGTDLTNFNAVLGVSTKTLQQYQYAARQVGASNQDVENTFKGLSSAMTKTLMGQGTTALPRVATTLKQNINYKEVEAYAKNPELLIQKLQEYAAKESNVGFRNEVLRSFGLNDKMISALVRQAFKPDVMAKAPSYSEGELDRLDRANIAWSNLGTKIEQAIGHFNALHGGQLVKDITMVTDQVIGMTYAFIKLSDQLQLFKGIGMIFEGWGHIFKGISDAIDNINTLSFNVPSDKENPLVQQIGQQTDGLFNLFMGLKDPLVDGMVKGSSKLPSLFETMMGDMLTGMGIKDSEKIPEKILEKDKTTIIQSDKIMIKSEEKPVLRLVAPPAMSPMITPAVAPVNNNNNQSSNQNIEVNQTLNFQHEGKDSRATSDSIKHAVQKAFRQLPSQVQGS